MTTAEVVDFFSGCGGASAGFEAAGHEIRLGVDLDAHAAATFRMNFPASAFLERDVATVSADEIATHLTGDRPVIFAGCAPCQPFSKQNRHRDDDDPRRSLLRQLERFVLVLEPDFVVIENVPGLQKIGSTGPLPEFIQTI
jgi:DNA (cytosine-5)-methyltransferase 1